MNRAEELLARKIAQYNDPDLAVYFLAAQARILMQLGEGNKSQESPQAVARTEVKKSNYRTRGIDPR